MVNFFIVIAMLSLLLNSVAYSEEQTTFRDSQGRMLGTAAPSNGGKTTTFRDSSGRMTGTATITSGGTTVFRDSTGRTTGTAAAPRR